LFSYSGLKQFNPIGRAIKSANCKPVELLLIASNQQKKITHIVVEQRGKTEDRDLELE
jgi:hypothetical protein